MGFCVELAFCVCVSMIPLMTSLWGFDSVLDTSWVFPLDIVMNIATRAFLIECKYVSAQDHVFLPF